MRTQSERCIEFIETFCSLGGSFTGQPFVLFPFQRDILEDLFSQDDQGNRLRRTYLLGLPRKNAKTTLAAAIALYMLIADSADASPQVVCAAGARKQAGLVFEEAKRMIAASPELSEVCLVSRHEIRCTRNNGTFFPVSSEAGLQEGLNPSFVVFDELHIFKNAELYNALTLGSGARRSPLFLSISTAGFDQESLLGRLYLHGLKVNGHILNGTPREGETDEPAFGMTWWGPEAGEEIDHTDPAIWEKYNPLWSALSNPETEFAAALATTHESAFIRYRLNGWTSAESSWLPHGAWADLADTDRKLQPKEPVVLGFDGSWRGDATALVAVSIDALHIEVLQIWEQPDNDPDWHTPVAEVEETIREACKHFNVREVSCDPYLFQQSLSALSDEGLPIVDFATNTPARMTPAILGFYELVTSGGLSHDDNPILARHLHDVVLHERSSGPAIGKASKWSKKHIDAAVATVIAVHRATFLQREVQPAPSNHSPILSWDI